jgi:hypothetical protein
MTHHYNGEKVTFSGGELESKVINLFRIESVKKFYIQKA